MKLTILCGLPASGKSTKADELLRASGNAVRINKDSLRTMLHFDRWSGQNEKRTRHAARALASSFLAAGLNVVVDDTNLNPGTLQGWKDLAKESGAHAEVIDVGTPLDECLSRDRKREKRVGDHVIVGMAMQYGRYPSPKAGVVICDLDGTLCDISHRRHFVREQPKNWKAFFEAIPGDTVRSDVLAMLFEHEREGREIFFVSGRGEEYRDVTETWLGGGPYGLGYRALFMRRAGDHRDDTIIKREIYDAYFKTFDVVEVIDDRPSVIRMWRDLGLNVRDVGDGIEF